MEPQPKFLRQLDIWATTLIELAGARASELMVHVVDGERSDTVTRYARERGIACVAVGRFGDGRFCNKLSQLRSGPLRERGGDVALCDTDLAFSGPITAWTGRGRAAAKTVDLPNPPLEMLAELYRRAGFARLPEQVTCSHAPRPTFANNCNGGLYLLRGDLLDELAPRWERWALWTLEQEPFLGTYVSHADQISFGLATWELGEAVVPLDPAANFPIHLPLDSYAAPCPTPVVLHYHDRLGPDGMLLPLGVPEVDARVAVVNAALAADRRARFDNAWFWDFRYALHPELGSGLGSRGRHAAEKRRLVAAVVADLAPGSVLDVGCGDLEVTHELQVTDYVGLDVSAEALRIARERRPDWRFVRGDLASVEVLAADLVLCLDVLIHERDPGRYRAAVDRLAALAGRELLVGAYNQEPWLTSPMTFFHEPISRTLHATGRFRSIEIAGGYRDTTVLRAVR